MQPGRSFVFFSYYSHPQYLLCRASTEWAFLFKSLIKLPHKIGVENILGRSILSTAARLQHLMLHVDRKGQAAYVLGNHIMTVLSVCLNKISSRNLAAHVLCILLHVVTDDLLYTHYCNIERDHSHAITFLQFNMSSTSPTPQHDAQHVIIVSTAAFSTMSQHLRAAIILLSIACNVWTGTDGEK